jgi:hypothetical protein
VPYSTAIVRIRQTKRYLTSWLSHDSAGLAVIVTGAKNEAMVLVAFSKMSMLGASLRLACWKIKHILGWQHHHATQQSATIHDYAKAKSSNHGSGAETMAVNPQPKMLRPCHNATNYAKAKSIEDDSDADTATINPQPSS